MFVKAKKIELKILHATIDLIYTIKLAKVEVNYVTIFEALQQKYQEKSFRNFFIVILLIRNGKEDDFSPYYSFADK